MEKEMRRMSLKQADRIEITTLVDSYTEIFMKSTEFVKRNPLIQEGDICLPLLAEHGLSWLIDIYEGSNHHQIMLDAGWTDIPIPYNIKNMGTNLDNVEALVLSHGHLDHYGGIFGLYRDGIIPKEATFVAHPDAFNRRVIKLPTGTNFMMPHMKKYPLEGLGVTIHENKEPVLLADGFALVTGEVERVTDFEISLPEQWKYEDGEIRPDHDTLDDQGIIFNVKDKGLVVLQSCSHSGIINNILYAKKLTGQNTVYAVLGGLHLSGHWESRTPATIAEIKKEQPALLVATHCTGWNSMLAFQREMPEEFSANSVGAKICL
ncbi:MAG: MBL fold metallo-hydrolase [Bacteroidetes bacterium]|nr:MBL fold metallo-hydrolase [Bacteroidota bacterium]